MKREKPVPFPLLSSYNTFRPSANNTKYLGLKDVLHIFSILPKSGFSR
jgi:hypothetical protein